MGACVRAFVDGKTMCARPRRGRGWHATQAEHAHLDVGPQAGQEDTLDQPSVFAPLQLEVVRVEPDEDDDGDGDDHDDDDDDDDDDDGGGGDDDDEGKACVRSFNAKECHKQ